MGIFENLIYTWVMFVVFVFEISEKVNGRNHGLDFVNGRWKYPAIVPVLKQEVVSIYDENFTDIPKDREPYYVKVQRCVIEKDKLPKCVDCWPQPMTFTEVEIVVPDLKNYTKFYKYIVYNHTSCYLEKNMTAVNFNLHKNLPSNESQMDFLKQNASNDEMRYGKRLILNYAVMCKEIVDKNIRMTKQ
ncbi:uncharacterized protein LOC124435234 [Xenia sp. Carnegie-2017]|uniref:uncharacterized protein LOC124435234 n=1 Tax=Xenia sp. Carnegie-2017 TaxID=2897299 RepID=UPI001F04C4DE|nr:uncharacterized protein LOC124435234 [Xenia sp. Carnegie-2017]